jgi:medium-chain acyl-[acyl-carrier-protein] hydrolase
MAIASRRSAPDAQQADVRLVCLPYAGGGSAVYYRWRATMPGGVDLVPICLPGREGRVGEPIGPDLKTVAIQVADEITPQLDRPFVLLGHSMGAWLAFELARELRCRAARLPGLLVVAASEPPDAPRPAEPLHVLPDEEFLRRLQQRFDGIPPAVRDNPELLQLLLPMLRADVRLVETYQCEPQPPLDVEILALGGTDDPSVSAAGLAGWRAHTTQKFSARLLPGDHFFLFRGDGPQPPDGGTAAVSPALQLILSRITALSAC